MQLIPSATAFRRARARFERERDAWLAEHAGDYAVIRSNRVLGFARNAEEAFALGDAARRGDTFVFRVRLVADEDATLRARYGSDWACICEPFLDTDMPQMVWEATRVLELRGYTPRQIRRLRLFAAGGLWWNVLWWEWVHLDLADVLLGWAFNCALLGLLAGLTLWATVGPWPAIAAFLLGTTGFVWLGRASRGKATVSSEL